MMKVDILKNPPIFSPFYSLEERCTPGLAVRNAFKILNTYVIGSQVSKTMSRRIDLDGAIARGSRLVFEPVNDMLETLG